MGNSLTFEQNLQKVSSNINSQHSELDSQITRMNEEADRLIALIMSRDYNDKDAICKKIAYQKADELANFFPMQTLNGIRYRLGVVADPIPEMEQNKQKVCIDIVNFYLKKINLISNIRKELPNCRQMEGDIYNDLVYKLQSNKLDTDEWLTVYNKLERFNAEIKSRYDLIEKELERVRAARSMRELDAIAQTTNGILAKTNSICKTYENDLIQYSNRAESYKRKEEKKETPMSPMVPMTPMVPKKSMSPMVPKKSMSPMVPKKGSRATIPTIPIAPMSPLDSQRMEAERAGRVEMERIRKLSTQLGQEVKREDSMEQYIQRVEDIQKEMDARQIVESRANRGFYDIPDSRRNTLTQRPSQMNTQMGPQRPSQMNTQMAPQLFSQMGPQRPTQMNTQMNTQRPTQMNTQLFSPEQMLPMIPVEGVMSKSVRGAQKLPSIPEGFVIKNPLKGEHTMTPHHASMMQTILPPGSNVKFQPVYEPKFAQTGIPVRAVADYIPGSAVEIELRKGQATTFLNKGPNGWSKVRHANGLEGYVPHGYLSK